MTTSTIDEVRRRKGGRPAQPRTVASLGVELFDESIVEWRPIRPLWPSATYRNDPVGFFRQVLGVEPWSRQIAVIEAVRDNPRVAVRAGHKVSKSNTIAGLAFWFFESFDDARVILSSTTARQVDEILWRECKMMHARSGRCVACKVADARKVELGERPGPRPCPHSRLLDAPKDGGPLAELARTGLKTADFREIVGFTADQAEAVAGISGKNILYLVDEASGVPALIFDAIQGNRAGGGRLALFGNPTQNTGEFFDAFEGDKRDEYVQITISSEESPNVVEGREVIPGLATKEWVEERERGWGRESSEFIIRVLGRHALKEEGRIVAIALIIEAEARWHETTVESTARLDIGLDPAGEEGTGDESAFSIGRGKKQLELVTFRGLTEDGHLAHLLGFIKAHRRPGELPPRVKVDVDGRGYRIHRHLERYLEGKRTDAAPEFELYAVKSSLKATRDPQLYDTTRDEMWAAVALWLREGGAIVEDVKLAKELHEPEWIRRVDNVVKATPKAEIRKKLKRSPDRADALILQIWQPSGADVESAAAVPARPLAPDAELAHPTGIDPYAMTGGGYR